MSIVRERLVVAQGGTVIVNGTDPSTGKAVNQIYRAGQIVPRELLTRAQVEEHLKSGYLKTDRISEPEPDEPTENPPGLDETPAVSADDLQSVQTEDRDDGRINPEAEIGEGQPATGPGPGPDESGRPVNEPVTQQTSPWVLDPDGLQGKDVGELNVMIQERDPSVEPFDTAEEAIAFLSQNHG